MSKRFINHARPTLPTDFPGLYFWHEISSYRLWQVPTPVNDEVVLSVKDLSLNPFDKNLAASGEEITNQIYKQSFLSNLDAIQTNFNEANLYSRYTGLEKEQESWFDLSFFWAITARLDILSFGNVNRVMTFCGPDANTENISMGYNQALASAFFRASDGSKTMTARTTKVFPVFGSLINPEKFPPNIIWAYKKKGSQVFTFGSNATAVSFDVTNYNLGVINYKITGVNGVPLVASSSGIVWGEQVFYLGDVSESTMRGCLGYLVKKWTGIYIEPQIYGELIRTRPVTV